MDKLSIICNNQQKYPASSQNSSIMPFRQSRGVVVVRFYFSANCLMSGCCGYFFQLFGCPMTNFGQLTSANFTHPILITELLIYLHLPPALLPLYIPLTNLTICPVRRSCSHFSLSSMNHLEILKSLKETKKNSWFREKQFSEPYVLNLFPYSRGSMITSF